MGEVYRAAETRLDGTVALELLPDHLASDAELRERFERDAMAVVLPPKATPWTKGVIYSASGDGKVRYVDGRDVRSGSRLHVFQNRIRVGCLDSAVPVAGGIHQDEHHGRHCPGRPEPTHTPQSEVGRRNLEGQAMDQIEEHRRLAEDQERSVLADANLRLDRPQKRQTQEENSQLQRRIRQ